MRRGRHALEAEGGLDEDLERSRQVPWSLRDDLAGDAEVPRRAGKGRMRKFKMETKYPHLRSECLTWRRNRGSKYQNG